MRLSALWRYGECQCGARDIEGIEDSRGNMAYRTVGAHPSSVCAALHDTLFPVQAERVR